MRIARFEKRLFAYLFDILLAGLASFAIFFLIPMNLTFIEKVLLQQIGGATIYFILTTIILSITNGFTLGSVFVRIRVVRLDDERLRLKDAAMRSIGLAIFPWVLINAIHMLIIHTERTVFDRLSETIVIDRKCY